MQIMKHTIVGIFLIFAFSMFGRAQSTNEFSGALLWEISGNGLEKPSYVIGTHHLAQLKILDNIQGLKKALNETEQVVGEIKIEDQAGLAVEIQRTAMLPSGYSYESMLTKEEYSALDSCLISFLGYGLAHLGKMKPGLITMLCSVTSFQKSFPEIDFTNHVAMDVYFQQQATQSKKDIVALETVEDQIYTLLDSQPYEEQARSLLCMVKSMDYEIDGARKLTEYYIKGDLTALSGLMSDPSNPCPMNEEQQNLLNKDRNDKWMQKIPSIMKEKPSFIAVGAIHIAGEDGLLSQLDKLGYTVVAVN